MPEFNTLSEVIKSVPFPREEHPESAESAILKAIRGIRYGSVEVTIHDARVVQIECRKKIRIQGGGTVAG
ncbi:MAG: YezD family protein [Acidobacteriota bacterium]|jgi:hypothetical protein|nr:YezD family protein [Acidobacteriota bacterium]